MGYRIDLFHGPEVDVVVFSAMCCAFSWCVV